LAELVAVCRRAARRARNYSACILFRLLVGVRERTRPASDSTNGAHEGHKRQLESRATALVVVVLSDSQGVLGASGGSIRSEANETAFRRVTEGIKSTTESDVTMQTALLKPDTHLRIRYPVPRDGWIKYNVEADGVPVTTWVLDEEGLKEFNSGKKDVFSYYGGFVNRYKHHQELKLPFRGWWYLIIENRSQRDPAAVHYEVSG